MKSMTERTHATIAIALALATLPAPMTRADVPLPKGADELIQGALDKVVPVMAAAIDLANREAKSDKNFVVLLKELKKYGFGSPVAMPPWANKPEHEDHEDPEPEDLTEEEKQEKERKRLEMIEATRKRVGGQEINYFKEIDKNGDTKTDAEEIATAIREYLVFELHDDLINVDGDKDGKLSLREYALSVPARGEIGEDGVDWHQREHFLEEDKDGSGFIELGEIMGRHVEGLYKRALRCLLMFQLAGHDKDGDGKLSREEFTAIAEGTDAIYGKIFAEGESLDISNAYARLFWVPSPALEKLVKR